MIKKYIKNGFFRNIIMVASGTAGAQAITIIFSPMITRLYGPENFGLLGTFIATLGLIMPIASLSYPIAIVLPKSDHDARALAKLSLNISVITTIILTIVIFFFSHDISSLLNIQDIEMFLFLIPIAMFTGALQVILQQWIYRKELFKITAKISIYQSFILNIFKVATGFFSPTAIVLITSPIIGNVFYSIQLFLSERKVVGEKDRITHFSQSVAVKEVAIKYKDFAIYRTPQVLINAISQSLPVLMLATLFGPASAGFFSLGKSILSAPATLIGTSISNVYYPRIAKTINLGENPLQIMHKATIATFLISILPFSIIIIFGESIFSFVFGNEWAIAGQYGQWMSLWVLCSLTARPLISTISAMQMQGVFLIYEVIFLILKIIALFFGGYIYKNAMIAVALYSVITAISYVTLYLYVCLAMKK